MGDGEKRHFEFAKSSVSELFCAGGFKRFVLRLVGQPGALDFVPQSRRWFVGKRPLHVQVTDGLKSGFVTPALNSPRIRKRSTDWALQPCAANEPTSRI
jgi:hypothetical protein